MTVSQLVDPTRPHTTHSVTSNCTHSQFVVKAKAATNAKRLPSPLCLHPTHACRIDAALSKVHVSHIVHKDTVHEARPLR